MFVEELKDRNEWESFLDSSAHGTFYHTPQWKDTLEKTFKHPFYLALRKNNGTLAGICPGFIVDFGILKVYQSTPRSDYAGPIVADHCQGYVPQTLLNYIHSYCSNNGIAYAKVSLTENTPQASTESSWGYSESNGGVMEIDLERAPPEYLWNKVFPSSLRKKISRVERNGFRAYEGESKADLKEFYALYEQNMRYIGASPFTYEFMENAWDTLYPKNLRVWLVGKNRPIAGVFVYKYRGGTYMSYTGIDRESSRTYSVNPYMVWQEIKKAKEEGCPMVSLGSTPGDPKETHYLQKSELGALFRKQTTVWYPFNLAGNVFLLCRSKPLNAWKNMRDALPQGLKREIEKRVVDL